MTKTHETHDEAYWREKLTPEDLQAPLPQLN